MNRIRLPVLARCEFYKAKVLPVGWKSELNRPTQLLTKGCQRQCASKSQSERPLHHLEGLILCLNLARLAGLEPIASASAGRRSIRRATSTFISYQHSAAALGQMPTAGGIAATWGNNWVTPSLLDPVRMVAQSFTQRVKSNWSSFFSSSTVVT